MGLQFQTDKVVSSLSLMLMGMVGIFVVMVIILGMIVLLNKVTDENRIQTRKARKAERKAKKAQLKDNMRSI